MNISFNDIFANKEHWKFPFTLKPIHENQRAYELTTKEKVVSVVLAVFSLPFFIGTFYLMTAYFKYRAVNQIQINNKPQPENPILPQPKLVIQQHQQKAIDPILSLKPELPLEQPQPKVLDPIFQPKPVHPLEQPQQKAPDPILPPKRELPLEQPQPKTLEPLLPQPKLELPLEVPPQMQTPYQPGLNLVGICPTFHNNIQLSLGFNHYFDMKRLWVNTQCTCCDKKFDEIAQPEKAVVLNDCQFSYHALNVETGEKVDVYNCITREPKKIYFRPENFRFIVFKVAPLPPENI